jgi:hypothetical protein
MKRNSEIGLLTKSSNLASAGAASGRHGHRRSLPRGYAHFIFVLAAPIVKQKKRQYPAGLFLGHNTGSRSGFLAHPNRIKFYPDIVADLVQEFHSQSLFLYFHVEFLKKY